MLKELINNYNKLYPNYRATTINVGNCLITEPANADGSGLQSLELSVKGGWQFHRDLPAASTAFHAKAQPVGAKEPHFELMRSDCDGILCIEDDDKNATIYGCELKSTYTVEEIDHARWQIIGSLVKLRQNMSILQVAQNINFTYKGIIAAYEATTEKLNGIAKLNSPKANFCVRLYNEGHFTTPKRGADKFWHPVDCPECEIRLIKVPYKAASHRDKL